MPVSNESVHGKVAASSSSFSFEFARLLVLVVLVVIPCILGCQICMFARKYKLNIFSWRRKETILGGRGIKGGDVLHSTPTSWTLRLTLQLPVMTFACQLAILFISLASVGLELILPATYTSVATGIAIVAFIPMIGRALTTTTAVFTHTFYYLFGYRATLGLISGLWGGCGVVSVAIACAIFEAVYLQDAYSGFVLIFQIFFDMIFRCSLIFFILPLWTISSFCGAGSRLQARARCTLCGPDICLKILLFIIVIPYMFLLGWIVKVWNTHDEVSRTKEEIVDLVTRNTLFAFINLVQGCIWNIALAIGSTRLTHNMVANGIMMETGCDQGLLERLVDKASNEGQRVLRIREKDLKTLKRVAVGGYGEVYQARWKSTLVAVKRSLVMTHGAMAISPEIEAIGDLVNELAVLSNTRHPNVLLFLGIVERGSYPDLVTEWCEGGSVFDRLHISNEEIPWIKRVKIALGTARGMEYLHSRDVVHRDLKSSNLLVDASFATVKVADFGMSRFTESISTNTARHGTMQWTAPEVLEGGRPHAPADVYSFAVVMWELAMRQVPFSDFGKGPIMVKIHCHVTKNGFDLPVFPNCPEPYAQLMYQCGSKDPALRPKFSEVANRLEEYLESIEDSGKPL